MRIDLSRFRDTFFAEAAEHLAEMEAGLLRLEETPDDQELVNCIFRAAHSIKGSAGTLGMDDIVRFTHVLEGLLDRLRDGGLGVTHARVDLLLRSRDVVVGLVAAAQSGTAVPAETDDVRALLEADLGQSNRQGAGSEPAAAADSAGGSCVKAYTISFIPHPDLLRQGQDPLLVMREIIALGVTQVCPDTDAVPPLAELDPESCYLSWTVRLETERSADDIGDVFLFVRDSSQVSITELSADPLGEPSRDESTAPQADAPRANAAPARPAVAGEKESVRVERGRLDKLINTIGELVIAQSMVQQEFDDHVRQSGFHSRALPELCKIARDLQELSLSLRMVPLQATFQKIARIVRDLSSKIDKPVRLHLFGEETELDKTVVDQLGDPLVHMVRNAVDHGIEPTAVRLAAGKPAEGNITLRAYHQGGNVYIELSDDGKGLDRHALLAKALERGLVQEGQGLTDAEVFALIFEPGFSTAKVVTDVSGRGVGMDVVRRNVEALQGSIHIRSQPGKGTTFTVRLPLTLAIMDGLSVGLGDEVYILPLLSVIESFQPRATDVHRLVGRGEVVVVRGETVPLLRLYQLLGRPARVTDPGRGLLVLVETQGKKYALLVDELLGQQQVVMKSLDVNFRKVEGIAGATILGDGRVAMILDVHGLTRLAGPSPAMISAMAELALVGQ